MSSVILVRSAVRDISLYYENMSPLLQLVVLVGGVFIFFGIHNYLQEAIISVPGFKQYGVMLGYYEVLGVTICSYMERTYVIQETTRKAPISAYPALTLCLIASSGLSNISLNYINFPTKVVFRSCKLIPTMIIASIIHQQIYTTTEYVCATAICIGLILFAAADWTTSPSFHPIGLAFVTASVCADAVLPNAQERVFKQFGSSRLEVTFFTNVFVLILMTVSTLLSGDFQGSLRLILDSHQLKVYFLIYTFIAHVAISFHMTVVKRFGGVAAVVVATGRKGMTLIVSFLLFPKQFSWYYPLGAILVLGGLTVSSLLKIKSSSTTKSQTSPPTGTTSHKNLPSSGNSQSTRYTHNSTTNEDFLPLIKSHQSDLDLDHNNNNNIDSNGR